MSFSRLDFMTIKSLLLINPSSIHQPHQQPQTPEQHMNFQQQLIQLKQQQQLQQQLLLQHFQQQQQQLAEQHEKQLQERIRV